MVRRSRNGCSACKKRKVKCDEVRPKCGFCQKRNDNCSYHKTLIWNRAENYGETATAGEATVSEQPKIKRSMKTLTFVLEDPKINEKKKAKLSDKATTTPEDAEALALVPSSSSMTQLDTSSMYGIQSLDHPEMFPRIEPLDGYSSAHTKGYVAPAVLRPVDPMHNYPHQEFFNIFVNVSSKKLVPIPFDENPYATILPQMAFKVPMLYNLLVAYGAAHKGSITGRDQGAADLIASVKHAVQLVNAPESRIRNVQNLMSLGLANMLTQLESDTAIAGPPISNLAVQLMMAMLEMDFGNSNSWQENLQNAIEIVDDNAYNLARAGDPFTFFLRWLGYMECMGSLSHNVFSRMPQVSWWPKWSGSLDYMTGYDLNLLPLAAEVANLIQKRNSISILSLNERAHIYRRALGIHLRLGDYWFEEYTPVNELSAMCILFQMALQLHIYRRLLSMENTHVLVWRLMNRMLVLLNRFIPEDSLIHKNMSFIIISLASEVPETHRAMLVRRMHSMDKGGFGFARRSMQKLQQCWEEKCSFICKSNSLLM